MASQRGNLQRRMYLISSVALLSGIFWYFFTQVTWQQVADLILNSYWKGVLLFLIFSMSQAVLRTWQYSILLATLKEPHRLIPLFCIVLVRNFCSDLLPARVGTAIYVYLVNNRLRVSLANASASFAIAFAIDLIAVVPIVVCIALLASGLLTSYRVPVIIAALLLFTMVWGALFALPRILRWSKAKLSWIERALPSTKGKLAEFLNSLADKITEAQHSGVYGKVLVLGIITRLCKYTALYFFLYALLAPRGFSLEQLPFPQIFVGLCSAEFAASLPIAPPGAFGLYEGVWATVFTMLGFEHNLAIKTGIAHHLSTQLYGYSLAAISLCLLFLPFPPPHQTLTTISNLQFALRIAATISLLIIATIAILM